MRWGCLLPLLFFATCTALAPASFRIADPMTNRPLILSPDLGYPVLVLVDGKPQVIRLRNRTTLAVPPGGSLLVPAGKESQIVEELKRIDPRTDGGWALRVKQVAPNVQDIELFWMKDSYWGCGYRATPTTATLRYRKQTGPGFAMIAGMYAFLINAAAWAVVFFIWRAIRHNRV